MERGGVNPIFYGFVFVFLIGLHVFHITLIQPDSQFAMLYFLIHALLQSALEFLILFSVALLFKLWLHKSFYFTFVSLVFTVLLAHVADFILVRIMGMTFFSALDLVLDETFENFIEMLQLTGIPLPYWGFFFLLAIVVLPAAALSLYTLTARYSKIRDRDLRFRPVLRALCVLPFFLLAVDVAFLPHVTKKEYIRFAAALPLKSTILPYPSEQVPLEKKLKRPAIHTDTVFQKKENLPNIYIWVVESLREDYVTEKTAPNVVFFREENVSLPFTVSGGNGTQLSWYSIFHGNSALHWAESRGKTEDGALPLEILKQMGYSIHLYTAAQLGYYSVDELLFGKKTHLLSSKHEFPHYPPKEAYESDLSAYGAMMADIAKKGNESGQVFLLFLDSTHFEYSWPPEYPAPYSIEEVSSHLQLTNSDGELERIKRCYKNSIHFVDSLFGKFATTLKKHGLYDESCIVFTGDHGEEFYEEGRLYHASHLSSMQTTPPIYYKLGQQNDRVVERDSLPISSHMDIMPTLLDHVSNMTIDLSFCEGNSLLRKKENRYAIVARYNGNRTPYEFYIHDGQVKCLLQFDRKKQVYDSKRLHIIHFFDRNEEEIGLEDSRALLNDHFQVFFLENFSN